MADGGYIKLFRQIEEWRFWDRPFYMQVWIHLLIRVDWKPGWKFGEPVGPGETIITLRSFAEECGISKDTLSRILRDLEAEKQIELSLRQGKTFIKVLNYAVFQGSETSPRDRDQTQDRTQVRTEDRTEDRTPSIYRRNKEIKNKRKSMEAEPPTLQQVESYISEIKGNTDPDRFFEYYQARDWKGITDWKAAIRSWEASEKNHRKSGAGKREDILPAYMTEHKRRSRE